MPRTAAGRTAKDARWKDPAKKAKVSRPKNAASKLEDEKFKAFMNKARANMVPAQQKPEKADDEQDKVQKKVQDENASSHANEPKRRLERQKSSNPGFQFGSILDSIPVGPKERERIQYKRRMERQKSSNPDLPFDAGLDSIPIAPKEITHKQRMERQLQKAEREQLKRKHRMERERNITPGGAFPDVASMLTAFEQKYDVEFTAPYHAPPKDEGVVDRTPFLWEESKPSLW